MNDATSTADTNYIGMLLEDIRGQNKAVLEAVGAMRDSLQQVPKREEFDELKQDVRIIKAAVTELSHHVNDHDHRIVTLETVH